MPVTDIRLNEIGKVKIKILEVESQLKEEKKISAKLRENSERKIQQLSVINDAITAEMEKFRWKKEEILFSQSSYEEECILKLRNLKTMENTIKEDIASFDILEFENEKLHMRLKEIATEQLHCSKAQLAEREARKQKNFDTRMKMEEILRKTIKNFDRNYQQEAISKMELEALQANAENNKIHTEFDLREQKTENLIRQQQLSYDQLMKLRIERDVVAVSTEIQEKNIASLSAQNVRDEKELAELAITMHTLKEDIASLRESCTYKQLIAEELRSLCAQLALFRRQKKNMMSDSVDVCHKLLKEGMLIAEQGRIHQSSQIAQRIGQLTMGSLPTSSAFPVKELTLATDKSVLAPLISKQLEQTAFTPQYEEAFDLDCIWRSVDGTALSEQQRAVHRRSNRGVQSGVKSTISQAQHHIQRMNALPTVGSGALRTGRKTDLSFSMMS